MRLQRSLAAEALPVSLFTAASLWLEPKSALPWLNFAEPRSPPTLADLCGALPPPPTLADLCGALPALTLAELCEALPAPTLAELCGDLPAPTLADLCRALPARPWLTCAEPCPP